MDTAHTITDQLTSCVWDSLPDSQKWIRLLILERGEGDDSLVGSLIFADIDSGVPGTPSPGLMEPGDCEADQSIVSGTDEADRRDASRNDEAPQSDVSYNDDLAQRVISEDSDTAQRGEPRAPSTTAINTPSRQIDYEATSYCVGNTEKTHKILLRSGDAKSRALPLTSSAFHMLKRFRLKTETRTLWVDAICIDQGNAAERADQIMLMHRIYTKTKRVLIYLGEPDATLGPASDLMARTYEAARDEQSWEELDSAQWTDRHNLPPWEDSTTWEPLKDFFCRPWFTRKWTIQECILPPRARFYCGWWEAEWEHLLAFMSTSYHKALGVLDHSSYSQSGRRAQLCMALLQTHAMFKSRFRFRTGHTFSLMQLADMFQPARTTDLRDHLFALLGLANDADDLTLKPTYETATILGTCLRYARFFLAQKDSLEVLYRAGLHGQKLLAPSWVPNWHGGILAYSEPGPEGPWNPLRRPDFYNIGRGSALEMEDAADTAILRLRGIVIDTIKHLANTHLEVGTAAVHYWDGFVQVQTQSRQIQYLEQCDSIISSSLSTLFCLPEETPETALWKTLICGVTVDAQRAPEEPYATSYAAHRKWLRGKALPQSNIEPFKDAYIHNNIDKIFGVTTAGYMGMFNPYTQVGDIVVALYGGDFPFVLRPRHTDTNKTYAYDYELVGQCYIHGLMEEGQFDINDPKHTPQWFDLGGEYEVVDPWQPEQN
ncbi:uncharacterized protein AB675_10194 [Cyphellophora attinorum]|uniref:Heterokaryon incompatibility domain-containing protein n=1 Tax=Cyphellophora attinorum TaxID=1664694 RepID=A0A0N0NHJ9_9EURO|nr:uncharacterized protein AB675_10194 [Phialophora attinorum]KPI34771.1 hypothetical protein AB675_10194 [Phialophora attinorum]